MSNGLATKSGSQSSTKHPDDTGARLMELIAAEEVL
jgi:hypothetical protein